MFPACLGFWVLGWFVCVGFVGFDCDKGSVWLDLVCCGDFGFVEFRFRWYSSLSAFRVL